MEVSAVVDDGVLLLESEEDLNRLVGRFDEICRKRKLKMKANKSKTIVFEKVGR